MNTTIFKVLFPLFLFVIISGCDKREASMPEQLSSNTDYIKYGTSFGMCVGYCVQSITITDAKINFEKKSFTDNANYPTVNLSEGNTEDAWAELINKIDFSSFSQLDEVIGCPDCADGGAEWIEIKIGNTSHKVSFEYRNEPEAVKNYIDYLRTTINSFDK